MEDIAGDLIKQAIELGRWGAPLRFWGTPRESLERYVRIDMERLRAGMTVQALYNGLIHDAECRIGDREEMASWMEYVEDLRSYL